MLENQSNAIKPVNSSKTSQRLKISQSLQISESCQNQSILPKAFNCQKSSQLLKSPSIVGGKNGQSLQISHLLLNQLNPPLKAVRLVSNAKPIRNHGCLIINNSVLLPAFWLQDTPLSSSLLEKAKRQIPRWPPLKVTVIPYDFGISLFLSDRMMSTAPWEPSSNGPKKTTWKKRRDLGVHCVTGVSAVLWSCLQECTRAHTKHLVCLVCLDSESPWDLENISASKRIVTP